MKNNKSIEGLAFWYDTEEEREAIYEYLKSLGYKLTTGTVERTHLPGYLKGCCSRISYGGSNILAKKYSSGFLTFEQFSALTGSETKEITLSEKYADMKFVAGDSMVGIVAEGEDPCEWKLVYDCAHNGFRLQYDYDLCVTPIITPDVRKTASSLTVQDIINKLDYVDIEKTIKKKLEAQQNGDKGCSN